MSGTIAPGQIDPRVYAAWRATPLGRITEVIEQRLIFELIGELRNARVLDAGCGDGALVDANRITVEVHGGEVTLRSRIPSWSERDETQLTASSTPGITKVNTGITVGTI